MLNHSDFVLIISGVLLFGIFYIAGALSAMRRNKIIEKKDFTDE
jgi:hypothetical protein